MGLLKLVQSGEGVLFGLLAGLGASVYPNLMRLAAERGVPDLQVVLVMELTGISVYCPSALILRAPLKGQTHRQTMALMGAGLLRVCSTTMVLLAAFYIPPAASNAINKGSVTLFVAVIAWLALREPAGWGNAVGMAVQATGIGLVAGTNLRAATLNQTVTEPVNVTANVTSATDVTDDVTRDYVIGVVLALVGTLGLATTDVFGRSFLQNTPLLTVLVYIESITGLLVFPVMYIFNTPRWNLDISVIGVLAGLGITYVTTTLSMYRSLKLEKASTVAVLRGLSVALAYAVQYWILGIVPVMLEYIGASFIVVSIVVVGVRNWYESYNSGTYDVEPQPQTNSIYSISMTVDVSQGTSNPAMSEQNRPEDDLDQTHGT